MEKVNRSYRVNNEYDVSISDGKFVSTKKEIDKLIELSKVYTKNQKQNNALKVGRQIIDTLQEAESKSIWFNKTDATSIFKFIGCRTIKNKQEIYLDPKFISMV